jgi:hypothetical protein
MPDTVEILEDLEIIRVTCRGEVTEHDLMNDRRELSRIHRERGFTRVLVDAVQATSAPETFPLFEHGRELARQDAARSMRYAVAVSPEVARDVGFLETVSRNRGVNMRLFESTDRALAWLRE